MLVEGHEGLSMAGKSLHRDPSPPARPEQGAIPTDFDPGLYPNRIRRQPRKGCTTASWSSYRRPARGATRRRDSPSTPRTIVVRIPPPSAGESAVSAGDGCHGSARERASLS